MATPHFPNRAVIPRLKSQHAKQGNEDNDPNQPTSNRRTKHKKFLQNLVTLSVFGLRSSVFGLCTLSFVLCSSALAPEEPNVYSSRTALLTLVSPGGSWRSNVTLLRSAIANGNLAAINIQLRRSSRPGQSSKYKAQSTKLKVQSSKYKAQSTKT